VSASQTLSEIPIYVYLARAPDRICARTLRSIAMASLMSRSAVTSAVSARSVEVRNSAVSRTSAASASLSSAAPGRYSDTARRTNSPMLSFAAAARRDSDDFSALGRHERQPLARRQKLI
jgi:hypothetical protein